MHAEWSLPQPFETVDHTADTGVRVHGRTPEETLARLILAHSSLLSGGEAVDEEQEQILELASDADLALVGVDVLRELNRLFCSQRTIATRVAIERFDSERVVVRLGFGTYDPQLHREGLDIKAVTFHAAQFEAAGDNWVAQVVFDI